MPGRADMVDVLAVSTRVKREEAMIQGRINEIQAAISRLHDKMELERERLNDALAAGHSPEEHLRRLATMQERMNGLLDQHNRANPFWRAGPAWPLDLRTGC